MNYTKYGFGVFLILIVAFLILGKTNPASSYSSTIRVTQPLNVVWASFLNDSLRFHWIMDLQQIEWKRGSPETKGSVCLLKYTDNEGSSFEMVKTIMEVETLQLYAYQIENDGYVHSVELTFTSIGDTTAIQSDNTISGKNLFYRSLYALMKTSFEAQTKNELESFRKNIE